MLLADLGSKDTIFLRKRVVANTGLGRLWFNSMIVMLFSLLDKSCKYKKAVCFGKHLGSVCLVI